MPSSGRKGFSLIELMVVVSILGLVIAVTLPGIRGYMQTERTMQAASTLAAKCNLARHMAISGGNPVEVFFNTSEKNYWVLDDDNGNGVADAGETVLGPQALPPHVFYEGVKLNGDGRLVFQPSGALTPGQSAMVVFSDSTVSDTVEVFSSGTISR